MRLYDGRQLATGRMVHQVQRAAVTQLEGRGHPPDRVLGPVRDLDEDRPATPALAVDRQAQPHLDLDPVAAPAAERGPELPTEAGRGQQGRHQRDPQLGVHVVEARGAQGDTPGAQRLDTGRKPARRTQPGPPAAAAVLRGVGLQVPVIVDVPQARDAVSVAVVSRPDGPAWRRPYEPEPTHPDRGAVVGARGPPAAAPAPARLLQDQTVRAAHRNRAQPSAGAYADDRPLPASGDHHRAQIHAVAAAQMQGHRPRRRHDLEVAAGAYRPAVPVRGERHDLIAGARHTPLDRRSPRAGDRGERQQGQRDAQRRRGPVFPALAREFGWQRAHGVCDRGSTPEGSRLTTRGGDGRTLAVGAPATVGRDEPDQA